jgi:hypothetical protein
MCGASDQQKDIGQQQHNLMTQMINQSQDVFGNSSQVFKDLVNSFAPTIAAGPNQEGFSAPEKSALTSQAITQSGQAYRNASQAVKEAGAAAGGGNEYLPAGADITRNVEVANAGAAQTASELNQIEQADYATGRQNYENAVAGMENAPNVFNPATGAGTAATGSGSAAAETANQISQANNSWVNAVVGGLSGIASSFATGGLSDLTKVGAQAAHGLK